MTKNRITKLFAVGVFLLCLTTAMASPAQTLTTLLSFDNADGDQPQGTLVQATNGNLYGTTYAGGANSGGTVFKVTPSGTLTTLYSFCSQSGCADGEGPYAGIVQATNGDFYGTTYGGGNTACYQGCGTVFKITPGGTLTILYSFCAQKDCADGKYPSGGLVQATNGELYGTASAGGNTACYQGCGTVFKITPSGTLTTLHSFCSQSNCADGTGPVAGLIQATNGNLYGTTASGGAGFGTVFKITPRGTMTTLHSFDYADGTQPEGTLVQASNGNLYGTTRGGGAGTYGTVFEITPSGTLKILYSFCTTNTCTDGWYPYAALVQATNGELYGTTYGGGAHGNYGTVFEITPSGTLTTLLSFDGVDGEWPYAALFQATNGDLYGTTESGGGYLYFGTAFSLSVGQGPFVETQRTSGKVGAAVKILGTKLTGATSVTFNGTAAVFKVVSASLITTTVPNGATTGKVKVKTLSGTLTSNVNFRVTP